MKVYVIDRGEKTLFYEGHLTREIVKQIKAEVKWYFNWKRLAIHREGDSITIMDGERIKKLRKEFFNKAVIA
jgi:ribosome biogenesis protein Nip4